MYHSTLGSKVIKKKKQGSGTGGDVFVEEGVQHPRELQRPVMLFGKGNSNSHGAKPVHLIITTIKWIRTNTWSMKSLGNTDNAGSGAYITKIKHLITIIKRLQ